MIALSEEHTTQADLQQSRTGEGQSYRQIVSTAWPIILANIAPAMLGLVDTAVIGNFGGVSDLGAIALGALIFNFIYWGFGCLRMGTTGFTAQALGASDQPEVRATLGRALIVASGIALLLLILQWPTMQMFLWVFDASPAVENATTSYFSIRIWGAPAALALFALMGTLIGLGLSKELLWVQLLMNGLNVLLDLFFAGYLGWGINGIALGTLLSEWCALAFAIWLVVNALNQNRSAEEPFWEKQRLRHAGAMLALLKANTDILIRTFLMLFGIYWFTNAGAVMGDAVLAANHILLQLVMGSAYFLDGFAFAAESAVGRSIGARSANQFRLVLQRYAIVCAVTAGLLAAACWAFGAQLVAVLTDLPAVNDVAVAFMPWCALYILLSFAAFLLDGVYIGATATRLMRNCSFISVGAFLLAAYWMTPLWGNVGLWIAFNLFVVSRAITLLACLPSLRRQAFPTAVAA